MLAHRLLNQHRRAARQSLQHAVNLIARHGDIEDHAGESRRLIEAAKDLWHGKTPRGALGGLALDVEQAGDRKIQAMVGGKMRRGDDGAGADDEDGPRTRGQQPRLPQLERPARLRTLIDRRPGQSPAPDLRGGIPAP